MARKRNRKQRNATNQNQAVTLNNRAYLKNMALLVSLALNRFRIVGLPESCNERFFLWTLLRYGCATLCHPDGMPDTWLSLQAIPKADYNAYGYPLTWRAMGADGKTQFECNSDNGVLVYYSRSCAAPYRIGYAVSSPWNALDLFAQRLAKYERTEDVNLTHQFTPWVLAGPPEKQYELINLLNQVLSGQPAVIGSQGLYDIVEQITKIDTQVPLITEDLARSKMNVFNEALMYLGIPHLAFEKGERMIEDEARANTAPTNVMLLDCLNGMRDGFKEFKALSGVDVQVYFNDDFESYNFNYLNNAEALAQDGQDVNVLRRVIANA